MTTDATNATAAELPPLIPSRRRWTALHVVWTTIVVFIAFTATQVIGMIGAGIFTALADPEFELQSWVQSVGTDGVVISVATCLSAAIGVPLIWLLVRIFEQRPWDFLGLRRPGVRHVLLACVATVAFAAANDGLHILLDWPVVPQVMIDIYLNTRWPALLIVSVVAAAPIFEELFFRGLIFGGLRASQFSFATSAILSSAAFAVVHLQYDIYEIVIIFFLGLLLAAARERTGSVIPCIAMHSLMNAIATVEVALIA